jgi:signal transduction histidine kinase
MKGRAEHMIGPLRVGRASVRLRLTLAYSMMFVVAIAGVLTGSYFLAKSRTGGAKTAVPIICSKSGQIQATFIGAARAQPSSTGSGQGGVVGQAQGQQSAGPPIGVSFSQSCVTQVVRASGSVVYAKGTGQPFQSAQSAPKGAIQLPPGLKTPGDAIAALTKAINASRDHTLNAYLFESVLAVGLMALLSIGFGWWIAGRALKPVHRITDTARRLSEQTLHDRINLSGPRDELKELADTFDAMLSRLDQSFTSQRRFVANASHELRTPLATERVLVDEALANPNATVEELRGILEEIRRNGEESERLINALLMLARSGRGVEQWFPVDLEALTATVVDRCAVEAAVRNVEIRSELQPAGTRGDPGLLERVAGNLLENALRHNVPGGWVDVRTGTQAGQAFLEVSNSGPAIEPSAVGGLLEPFRRAGPDRSHSGEGFGLGLSIVDAVVSAHAAHLSIRARPDGGLVVRVDIRAREPVLSLV